jgi:hypothetical protein
MNLECFTDPVRESPVPAGGLQMWLICDRNQTFLLALTSSDDVLMHNQRCTSIVEYAKNLIALSLSTFFMSTFTQKRRQEIRRSNCVLIQKNERNLA